MRVRQIPARPRSGPLSGAHRTPGAPLRRIEVLGFLLPGLLIASALHARTQQRPAIQGRVVDRETRLPVAQAAVRLDDGENGSTTDDDGEFHISSVEQGTHRLRVARLGYLEVVLPEVLVRPGHDTWLLIELERSPVPLRAMEVRTTVPPPSPDIHGSARTFASHEIHSTPGAIGDVFRVLQSLPGVGVPSGLRNDVITRGGSPHENLVLVDGFELPSPSHFASQGTGGGGLSILQPGLVRETRFISGGFPAVYGDRLSSVIDVHLREGRRGRFRSATELNAAGASQLAEGPMGTRGSWLVAARQGTYDLLARVLDLDVVPFTTDGQALWVYEPTFADQVTFLGLAGQDRVHVPVDASRPAETFSWDIHDRGWRSLAGADWRHRWPGRGSTRLAVSDVISRFDQDIRDAFQGMALVHRNRSREETWTLQGDGALRTHALGEWEAGASIARWRTRHELSQPLGTEDPFSNDPARVNVLDIRREDLGWTTSSFAQTTLVPGPRLRVTLGARAGRFGALHAGFVEPRLGLTLKLSPPWEMHASAGRHHQQPPLVYIHAEPKNAALRPMRADDAILGLEWTLGPDIRATVEAYEKRYHDYPASTDHPSWTLASQGELTGAYEQLLPLASIGVGRARGLELALDAAASRGLRARAGFSLASTKFAGADGAFRPGAYDLPRSGVLLLAWTPGPRWECSARFRAATGRPFTPPLEPNSTQQGRYIYDLRFVNAFRTPAFRQLDLRVDRRLTVAGRAVRAYAEAQNALGRRNVFRYVWDAQKQRLSPLPELGFLPLLGIDVEF